MKENLIIRRISKSEAKTLLGRYHYLKDISKDFKSGINYGGFLGEELVAVAIYTGFPVPELAHGLFGLPRTEQQGLFELSRLCIHPEAQTTIYNLTSFFLSRTLRLLRKEEKVRAVLSYADSKFHRGTIYAACNFRYYGLTAAKKDFFFELEDGSFVKHSRGSVKGAKGEWRDRTRKHRFLLVFDKTLIVKWKEIKWSPHG